MYLAVIRCRPEALNQEYHVLLDRLVARARDTGAHAVETARALASGADIFLATSGELWASIQRAIPVDQRAMGAALATMTGAILGHGLGPVLIGAFSDLFAGALGEESLRYGLLTAIGMASVWGVIQFALLSRAMRVARLASDDDPGGGGQPDAHSPPHGRAIPSVIRAARRTS